MTKERKIKSLSWSKINSFKDYKSQFIKQYFAGEPFYKTKEIIFGKVLGAILETGGFDIDEVLKAISTNRKGEIEKLDTDKILKIKNSFEKIVNNEEFCEKLISFQFGLFPNYEVELKEFVKSGEQSICCLGYVDNSEENFESFREFKTGKGEWTQEKANKHGQITFYAMMVEDKTGKLPKKAYLDWIETMNDIDGSIIPTGVIYTFEVEINPKEVKKMRDELHIIFDDMQKEYEKWLNAEEGKLELNDGVFYKYAELEKQKKAIENEQQKIKIE